jgi:hypothetical protein
MPGAESGRVFGFWAAAWQASGAQRDTIQSIVLQLSWAGAVHMLPSLTWPLPHRYAALGLGAVHVVRDSGHMRYKQSTRSSAGADKWLDVQVFGSTQVTWALL